MQFSERWLRSLVKTDLAMRELGHLLTLAGLELESLQPVAPAFEGVVVAEILATERHPNADRLQVCSVRVGEEAPLAIVCGAPNARAGLKTACALVGARLPELEIRQATVRGVESFGMLCSAKELGIDADAAGILELPADAPVGASLRDYLHLDDRIVTLKLTPNRGDCLSLTGIAREVAALTGAERVPVDSRPVQATLPDVHPVNVEAPDACPIYCGRVLRGLDPRCKDAGLDARTPGPVRTASHPSGGRCHQLRAAGIGAAHARLRPGQATRPRARAYGACRRVADLAQRAEHTARRRLPGHCR
jgi:phenylalanyl-tRNA synthetase beta chain